VLEIRGGFRRTFLFSGLSCRLGNKAQPSIKNMEKKKEQ
jgi:hypothetical protein